MLDAVVLALTHEAAVLVVAVTVRVFVLIPLFNALAVLSEPARKPKPRVATWTDRRALARQERSDALKPAKLAPAPRRWSRKTKIALAAIPVAIIASTLAVVPLAPRSRAAALCKSHASDNEYDGCVQDQAKESKNSEVCGAMRDATRIGRCVAVIDRSKSDGEVCMGLANAANRDDCIMELTRWGGNPELCELVEGEYQRTKCGYGILLRRNR